MIFKSYNKLYKWKRKSIWMLFSRIFTMYFSWIFLLEGMALAGKMKITEETSRDEKIEFPSPESHKNDWIKQYGISARMDFGLSGNLFRFEKSCIVCHESSDCTRCHNISKPQDHNGTWRTFTHGLSAEADISSCSVCHRQSYCIRCHAETAPSTHRGGWNTGHCSFCHYDSSFIVSDGCGVCHKYAQHRSAPHPISSKLDCLQCHG